jgi:hypothetical protein
MTLSVGPPTRSSSRHVEKSEHSGLKAYDSRYYFFTL